MKKKLWMGLVLTVAFCACAATGVFADEKAQTNCIGDTTGKTNCASAVEEEVEPADSSEAIAVENEVLEFGRIVEVGRRYSKNLTISNKSKNAITVRVEAVSYESDVLDESQKATVDWIAFGGGRRRFDVAAGASVQVSVRLMVPADTKGGTYYAKIKISDGNDSDDKYVVVKADVALDGYAYGGKVSAQNIGFFNVDGKVSASARMKNEGTAGFAAHYTVQYKNAFGLPEWKQIIDEEREVLPGAEELFEVGGDAASIGFGVFTVEQKISYINSENRQVEAVLSHAVVNLPWWSLAIAAGVVVLIIAIIVVLVRARRKKTEEAKKAKKENKKSRKKTVVEVVEEE